MRVYLLSTSALMLSASIAVAGGFELQTLDTSIMYSEGNQASISTAKIDASIEGYNSALGVATKKAVVKDQTVTNFAAKFDVGDSLSFGLNTYRSGAIQLDGGNAAAPGFNLAPTGDVDLDTTAFMLKYNVNDSISLIGGITQNTLKDGNVTTLAGSYDISGTSEQGYIMGLAYSIPEIALRAELTYQPKTTFNTTTNFGPNVNPASATTLALPETFALSFQTGIAADTLLTASYRKANWSKSQISVTVAPGSLANIDTEFSDSVAYSIGIGRKFTENLSGSITYSKEEGSSSTAESLFTVSNGSDAISIGLQYKRDNMTISGGVSQRNVGDVTVDPGLPGALAGHTMKYTGNSVTATGLKVSFSF
jgi:long-chain fatty acid transport protein